MILDIRTTPELDETFDSFITSLAKKFDFEWTYHSEPVSSTLVNASSDTIQLLLAAANLDKHSLTVSPGATDQGEFVGKLGADIVVFGPGEFSQAHQPNEFIYMDKLADFYSIMLRYLLAENTH